MSNPFRQSVPVKRRTGSYIKGRWVNDVPVNDTIIASIQPVTGRELESLNIGRAELGKVKIYTDDTLNISDEESNKSGDIIVWNGKKYEIIAEEKWRNNIINHNKYYGEYRGVTS